MLLPADWLHVPTSSWYQRELCEQPLFEKLPGKFKNLFRKFENLTDPCRNHKSYREVLSRMKPPVIPFVPLILKEQHGNIWVYSRQISQCRHSCE
uniref:Uncharacterized protein n=1 Tax=Sphaerodactylus townsendi TaxID=933632 RepID=A0ACB8EV76_9SAUR